MNERTRDTLTTTLTDGANAKQPRIAGGVRHSMRVTRLRDLVEISPDLWAPSESAEAARSSAAAAAENNAYKGDGSAQATIFKELLLASQHFRLYS